MATATLEAVDLAFTVQPEKLALMRRRQRAWQMRKEGQTLEAIAAVLGITAATVCRDLQLIERMRRRA